MPPLCKKTDCNSIDAAQVIGHSQSRTSLKRILGQRLSMMASQSSIATLHSSKSFASCFLRFFSGRLILKLAIRKWGLEEDCTIGHGIDFSVISLHNFVLGPGPGVRSLHRCFVVADQHVPCRTACSKVLFYDMLNRFWCFCFWISMSCLSFVLFDNTRLKVWIGARLPLDCCWAAGVLLSESLYLVGSQVGSLGDAISQPWSLSSIQNVCRLFN